MPLALHSWHTLSRGDRYVRRATLRLPAGVSEHRASLLVEEALRLMALPGEDQGRAYFFRRVALRDLPASAPPREWVERAQSTMYALAERAVHGSVAHAAGSDAVFFNSQQEALEWLLRRIFRAHLSANGTADWFAPMIAPIAATGDRAMKAVAVIERLRSLPAGWFAVASALLDTIDAEPAGLTAVASIPERILRVWLGELGPSEGQSRAAARQTLWVSGSRRAMLLRLLAGDREAGEGPAGYGSATLSTASSGKVAIGREGVERRSMRQDSPMYLLWLTALAVVAEHPGELARGSCVVDAREVLEELSVSLDRASQRRLRDPGRRAAVDDAGTSRATREAMEIAASLAAGKRSLEEHPAATEAELFADLTLSTSAAGLYFILNVLRYLGIEAAIEAMPAPFASVFLPRLIKSIARFASVPPDDPALLWVASALGADSSDNRSDELYSAAECWPRTLPTPGEGTISRDRLIRIWTLAARRWCWQNARLRLHEIVLRPGRILLTRTDLDVTLSMETVDLRVRRAGLDLDPGWLPWFGRVVRFHYVHAPSRGTVGGGDPA